MLNGDSGNNDGGMSFNPFVPPKPSGMPSSDKDFDVDELVKRIDAKIAELEEEEKREQEKLAKDKKEDTSNITNSGFEEANSKTEEILDFTPEKTETNAKPEITDDQFFDDFFDDS